jgi:hypothetical protein
MSLVVVVSMVGLLSLLAVGGLSLVTLGGQTSRLEGDSIKTEALAEAAFDTVLADLADEMAKGAAAVTENPLPDGSILRQYDFTGKPTGLVVSKALKPGLAPGGSLAKQSAVEIPFHTRGGKPSSRAANAPTATGSNPLPPSLWDKPRLLPPEMTFSSESAPDWIFMSRDGSNPSTFDSTLKGKQAAGGSGSASPNPKFVVGRYAYNLYDTSGLLDINVAGHPSTKPDAQRVGQKGTLALADLASLPGMSGQAVDDLAGWKHDWENATAEAIQDYLRLSEGSGWQKLAANDNLFLSRQDLLRFSKLRPETLPPGALPSLTHFSRDLDAPSWRPHPSRPKIARKAEIGGNDAHGQDDVLNPNPTSFDEKRGRQLLPRRFPLERLKWVATPGKAGPVDPEKAERYFGLRWQGANWEYIHARSDGRMYTLQDVPEDREPNFFEILRSTVLVGSLGRQFAARGHDAIDQLLSMHQLPRSGGIGGIDSSVNLNIMEMGACLIDQADLDSWPTAITMPGTRPYYVFGKEDVPYLNRLSAIPYRGKPLPDVVVYRTDGSRAPSEAYEGSMVLQPMLWRPHQVVQAYNGPTSFRIRPRHIDQAGGSMFYMTQGWRIPTKGDPPGVPDRGTAGDYTYWGGPNYRRINPEFFPKTFRGDEFIDFVVPAESTAFREPQSLHSPDHGAIAGYSISGGVQPVPVRKGDLRWVGLPDDYTEVSGFLVGHALTAKIENGATSWNRLGVGYFRGDPIEVQMEYQGPDGDWRPYQLAEFTYKSNWGDHYLRPEPLWQTEAFHWSSYLIDPRTARFGGLATVLAGGLKPTEWTSLHPQMTWPEGAALAFGARRNEGVRPGWTGPAANTGWNYNGSVAWFEPFNPGSVVENTQQAWDESSSYSFAYKDPDDVLRPGVAAVNRYDRSISVGNPMFRRCTMSTTGKLTLGSLEGRPKLLNRPFRSVAEMAYSFRGTPWRDIDFLNPSSPDSGLLDVFSLYEDPDPAKADDPKPPVVSGRVNLNSASVEVIAALLRGTALDDDRYLDDARAAALANDVYLWVRSSAVGQGPFTSKAALVSASAPTDKAKGLIFELSKKLSNQDQSINDRREFAVRALSDGTTMRGWNFLLDLVVQSGQLAPTSTGFDDFQVSAERRYWIHFAIDRPTGKLIATQWENVVE